MARIFLEFVELAKTFGEESAPELFTLPSLILGLAAVLIGYASLYSLAAVGALEPPGLGATRISMIAVIVWLWVAAVLAIFASLLYFGILLVIAAVASWVAYRLWLDVQAKSLWQVFGERIHRRKGIPRLRYLMMILGIIIMVTLGIIYAILTERIELPPSIPNAGELLYSTTFDNFNDEWDLPQGRQKAEIVDQELVLTEASGIPERGFYSLLEDRKFSDFDLRVRTRQISGDIDNSYGVIFRRKDTSNYYIFEISGDGYYRLSKVINDSAESITPWTESSTVHQGNVANEIRIIAKDDQFSFEINQQPISLCTKGDNQRAMVNPRDPTKCETNEWQATFQDDAFRQGRIALAVGTTRNTDLTQPIVIGFDNIIIVGPE